MMSNDERDGVIDKHNDDVIVCSLCGSRTGPFRNVRQGGDYNKILGCACPRCLDLNGVEWFEAVKPLLPKGQAESMLATITRRWCNSV